MDLKSKIHSFEEQFEDGVYAIPKEKNSKRLKVRALYEYCNEKGISPKELSEDELKHFLD